MLGPLASPQLFSHSVRKVTVGYVLEAVIAETALLRSVAPDLTGTRPATLNQGLGLVTATDEFAAGMGAHRFTEDWAEGATPLAEG